MPDPRLIALNRFGLGAHAASPAEPGGDPRGWLLDQLEGGAPALEPAVSRGEVTRVYGALRGAQRSGDPEAMQAARRGIRDVILAESRSALTLRVTTDRPFLERLVAFWSNHLCVSIGAKPIIGGVAAAYEREVIRPHVLGRFEDMVLASARHPAMLLYLDNAQSIGPNSRFGKRPGRGGQERGLNENYARELLELHTLGVDGGYDQEDVRELARVLTGWGLEGVGPGARGEEIAFRFREGLHEPGKKRVVGRGYGPGGVSEGEEAIRDLVRHPSTARFVAGKLARHFVADDPPESAVRRLEEAFRESDGDLAQVSRALVALEEAWEAPEPKFRTPQDWLVAMLRALGVREVADPFVPILQQLRHPLWSPPSPKGYGDTTADWADPDALLNRAELARTVARRVVAEGRRGRGGAVGPDPRALLRVMEIPPGDPLPGLLADESIPTDERVALAFAAPAFQWR